MSRSFKISVIVPIYNVEKYLEETINSVINQSLGFEENIQLILVNDGSPDKSEDICLKYKTLYPENVIYILQENAGVSAARNNGLKYATGEYVNFLDSDDKWSLGSYFRILDFFDGHKEEIDFVSCRMKHFDKLSKFHSLDYKFTGNKVIDITRDYDYLQLHITSTILKTAVAKQYLFNEELKYGEDALYLNTILLNKLKYGIFSTCLFYYRVRSDGSSAVQGKENNIDWYSKTPFMFYEELEKQSIQKYGYVLPYIQNLIAYDYQWRVKSEFPTQFEDFKSNYLEVTSRVLKNIDDKIIIEQKNINYEHKKLLLDLKYNKDVSDDIQIYKGKLFFNNLFLLNLGYNGYLTIKILTIEKDNIVIGGEIPGIIRKEDINFYVNYNDIKKQIELKESPIKNIKAFTGIIAYKYEFRIELPLQEMNVYFTCNFRKLFNIKLNVNFSRYGRLNKDLTNSYYKFNDYCFLYKNNNLVITQNQKKCSEIKYIKELFKKVSKKVAILRCIVDCIRKVNKKPIWLVYDKFTKADDNAEHFYRYLKNKKLKDKKIYFVLDKASEDYERLKKEFKIIQPHSKKHKILHLCAEKIISSHATESTINPLGKNIDYFRDLLKRNHYFLQHGIIQHDHAESFYRMDKNLALFVTSVKSEYDSIIEGNYDYDGETVKLTGLPRYDALYNYRSLTPGREIVILPTWRKYLTDTYNNKTYKSKYSPDFKNSEFYIFYNSIITDEELLSLLKEKNYKIRMCLHPIMEEQWVDFVKSENVIVNEGYVNYREIFKNAAMLITDYSSIALDFAYVLKPVIYTHFDQELFFKSQGYKNDDKHFKDLELGPVGDDISTTLSLIKQYIKNDCKLDDYYLNKMKNFYTYHDNNNCTRVYEEICKINWN